MLKRIGLIIIFLVNSCFGVYKDEMGRLLIGTTPFLPYMSCTLGTTYPNNTNFRGFDFDLLMKLTEEMSLTAGKNFTIKCLEFNLVAKFLEQNKLSFAACGFILNRNRIEKYRYSVPYLIDPISVVVKKNEEPSKAAMWFWVFDYKVAIMLGSLIIVTGILLWGNELDANNEEVSTKFLGSIFALVNVMLLMIFKRQQIEFKHLSSKLTVIGYYLLTVVFTLYSLAFVTSMIIGNITENKKLNNFSDFKGKFDIPDYLFNELKVLDAIRNPPNNLVLNRYGGFKNVMIESLKIQKVLRKETDGLILEASTAGYYASMYCNVELIGKQLFHPLFVVFLFNLNIDEIFIGDFNENIYSILSQEYFMNAIRNKNLKKVPIKKCVVDEKNLRITTNSCLELIILIIICLLIAIPLRIMINYYQKYQIYEESIEYKKVSFNQTEKNITVCLNKINGIITSNGRIFRYMFKDLTRSIYTQKSYLFKLVKEIEVCIDEIKQIKKRLTRKLD